MDARARMTYVGILILTFSFSTLCVVNAFFLSPNDHVWHMTIRICAISTKWFWARKFFGSDIGLTSPCVQTKRSYKSEIDTLVRSLNKAKEDQAQIGQELESEIARSRGMRKDLDEGLNALETKMTEVDQKEIRLQVCNTSDHHRLHFYAFARMLCVAQVCTHFGARDDPSILGRTH